MHIHGHELITEEEVREFRSKIVAVKVRVHTGLSRTNRSVPDVYCGQLENFEIDVSTNTLFLRLKPCVHYHVEETSESKRRELAHMDFTVVNARRIVTSSECGILCFKSENHSVGMSYCAEHIVDLNKLFAQCKRAP